MRLVSMLPSATEIIQGLGLIDQLVARSHECDYPPCVESLPIVTFANINPMATSRAIDDEVQSRLARGLSLYGIHQNRLRELAPDFIITQTQCDVCAVSLADVKAFLRNELGVTAELIVLAPNTLKDVWQDIRNVSQILGCGNEGETLIESLDERLRTISAGCEGRARPRVAVVEWIDPLMAAGNWVPELVAKAGGTNLIGETGVHSNWMSESDLVAANPDKIIVTPCGFDLERTKTEMVHFKQLPSWNQLQAVQTGQVYATDGNAYFNRPGPRLVESAEILAEILHPDHFLFGHAQRSWQQFAP